MGRDYVQESMAQPNWQGQCKTDQPLMPLTCIQEVTESNLSWDIVYPHWNFS